MSRPDAPLAVVVLAAGEGTRMKSSLPKCLHPVGGFPMLAHVLRAAAALGPERVCVITGHGGEAVARAAAAHHPGVRTAEQAERLGTAHAVQCARAALEGFGGDVLILYGDTPLVRTETLERLLAARHGGAAVAVLGFEAADPTGYGRLILGTGGDLLAIVEHREATEAERAVRLCNSGVMAVDGARLWGLLDRVRNDNAKGEYYLTDLVALARADGLGAAAVRCAEAETLGVNSRAELAAAEAAFQARARAAALSDGVTLTAPETVWFALDTRLAHDVTIGPNVVFGPGVTVETGAEIRAFSHLEGAEVAAGAVVGPFARLRPGARIGAKAHVGNFVEVKNAVLEDGAKANHLTYLGDATVGTGANIGAGTITCNYDGFGKHRTEIGAGAFVGSNTALVAPVTVGPGALIAAGSTITRDVPADALAVARGRQENRPEHARKLREKLSATKKSAGKAAE